MIQEIISDIVAQLIVPGSSPQIAPKYVHGWGGWQNLEVDEVTNDIVILDEPVQSVDKSVGNILRESYLPTLFFFTKSELEFTPDQHLPLINAMRTQRKRFIKLLESDTRIMGVSDIKTTDLVNVMDSNLTGVQLSLTVIIKDNVSSC